MIPTFEASVLELVLMNVDVLFKWIVVKLFSHEMMLSYMLNLYYTYVYLAKLSPIM